MSKIFGAVVVAGALLVAPAALATTITIDDFTATQTVSAVSTTESSSLAVAGVFGGNRFMQAATSSAAPSSTQFTSFGGLLSFGNNQNTLGTGWVVYDGTADRTGLATPATVAGLAFGTTINPAGIPAVDLLQGLPNGFFNFGGANFDKPDPGALEFSAFAWDASGRAVSYFEAVDLDFFTPNLFFSEFRSDWTNPLSGLGGFNWGAVTALAFRVDTTVADFDGSLTGITTAAPIPLPASVVLLLGGLSSLAGMSVMARRRQKA